MRKFLYRRKNKSVVFDEKYEGYFLTVICGLVVGIFWISFIIWNRLIRERLPRDLTLGEPYSITFLIVLILFLYFLGMIIIKVYFWIKAWRGITKTNKYIIKFTEWSQPKLVNFLNFQIQYILGASLYVWRYLYFKFPYEKFKYKFFINPISNFGVFVYYAYAPNENRKKNVHRYLITLISFVYLPRIIAFSVFLYEITMFKELNYFYTVAVILLLPLIFQSLRRILFDIGHYEMEFLKEEQIIVDIDSVPGFIFFRKKNPELSEEDFDAFSEDYNDYYRIKNVMGAFFIMGEKYDSKGDFLMYILLMLSLLFWLLIILKIY
jgi:hypothetical protein